MPARSEEALDIAEEYNNTPGAQSNARFLANKHVPEEEMEGLLKRQHELIPPGLQNAMRHRSTSSEIELALAGYFNASAEASEMCIKLLGNLESVQTSLQACNHPFPASSNSFSTTTRSNFRQIHDKYSSTFQSFRSSHRKVARKLNVVKAVKKLLKTCLVVSCGAAAATAIAAAPHLLFLGLLVGPAAAGLCPTALKRRITVRKTTKTKRYSWDTSLLRLREQLDTAAKGTYVLGRDLDTVSHLMARLSDGIERENAMAMCCVERVEERRSVVEMVRELRRSWSSSKRLAEELEEHVCLCLATIHSARVLVIQEISKQE
ncbi:hypothetical protein EJB05_38015, partial [Eragrostis curvula]